MNCNIGLKIACRMFPTKEMLKWIVGYVCIKLKTYLISYNSIIIFILVNMTSVNISQQHGSFST